MPRPPHKDLPNLGKEYFWLDTVDDGYALMHVYKDTRDNYLWGIYEYTHKYSEWFPVTSKSVVVYEPIEAAL